MEQFELADILLKIACEMEKVPAKMLKNETKVSDFDINELKDTCRDYGKFIDNGFDGFTWTLFRINQKGRDIIKNGGLISLRKKEIKKEKRSLKETSLWITIIVGIITIIGFLVKHLLPYII